MNRKEIVNELGNRLQTNNTPNICGKYGCQSQNNMLPAGQIMPDDNSATGTPAMRMPDAQRVLFR